MATCTWDMTSSQEPYATPRKWLWPTWPSSSRSKTNALLVLTLPKFPLSTNRGVTGTRRSPWAWSSERALSHRLLQTLPSPSQGCRVSPWLWEAAWDLMVISRACSNGFLISVEAMAVLLDSSPGVFLFFFFNLYDLSSWIGGSQYLWDPVFWGIPMGSLIMVNDCFWQSTWVSTYVYVNVSATKRSLLLFWVLCRYVCCCV